MKESTKPAMAKPRGCLPTPIAEKTTPRIHNIQFKTGTHENMMPNNAKTKPAVPIPLDEGGRL